MSRRVSTIRSLRLAVVAVPALAAMLAVGACENPANDQNGSYFPTPVYPSPYEDPTWSPDGSVIIFRRMKITELNSIGGFLVDPDSTGLWVINADGSDMRLLLAGMNLNSPVLSSDGQWLAYHSGGQIYKTRYLNGYIDTTSIVQLTTEGRNFFPTWSPDGEWIAYDSNSNSPNGMNFIWKMRADGSEKFRIAYDPTQGEIRQPHWSPCGDKIVHIRYGYAEGDKPEIFIMDTSGTSVQQLTSLNTRSRSPQNSPSCDAIVFESNLEIWIMNGDGSDPHQVTNFSAASAAWSPDGHIVYVRHDYWEYDQQNGTLWTMAPDGSNQRQLTYNYGLLLKD